MATAQDSPRQRRTPAQARALRRARRNRRRRLVRFGAGAGIGMIAVAFIMALFAGSLPISIGGQSTAAAQGERLDDQGRTHISPGDSHPAYNSVPATSGWHNAQPLAPVRSGVHQTVLPDEVLVHNLEHGGVGVHYDCPDGCDELVELLEDIVNGVGEVVMSPYPGMGSRIALTSWTFIDKFDLFDEERINGFIAAHLNSTVAPEYLAR